MTEKALKQHNMIQGMRDEIDNMVERFNEQQSDIQEMELMLSNMKRKQAESSAIIQLFKERYFKEVASSQVT